MINPYSPSEREVIILKKQNKNKPSKINNLAFENKLILYQWIMLKSGSKIFQYNDLRLDNYVI